MEAVAEMVALAEKLADDVLCALLLGLELLEPEELGEELLDGVTD